MLPHTRWCRALSVLSFSLACARTGSAPGILAPDRGGVVESRWEDGHVFVRLFLGDRPLWLLLDSGASNTLLRANVLADIGALPVGAVLMDGTARRFPVRAYTGATLRAGPGDAVAFPVPTLYELPAGVPALDGLRGVDGIVGFELFAQSRVVLDPNRRMVRVLARTDSGPRERDDVGFEVRQRLPVIDAELWFTDGTSVRAPFILDLGSNGDVRLTPAFAADHHIEAHITNRERAVQAGLWVDERGVEGKALAVKIGNTILRTPGVFIASDSIGALARAGVAGTIGLGVLQHYRMRLDYSAQRVTLRRIIVFAERDTTTHCQPAAPRRPVVMRGRPFVATAATAGPQPDDCEVP